MKYIVEQERVAKILVVDNAELEVSSPRQTQTGLPHEITIVVTNRGTDTVYWWHINGYRDCTITVFDSKKKRVAFTDFGRERMGGDPSVRTKNVRQALEPGQAHSWRIDLAKCFELPPGDYTFSVSLELKLRGVAKPLVALVEDVPFHIAP